MPLLSALWRASIRRAMRTSLSVIRIGIGRAELEPEPDELDVGVNTGVVVEVEPDAEVELEPEFASSDMRGIVARLDELVPPEPAPKCRLVSAL